MLIIFLIYPSFCFVVHRTRCSRPRTLARWSWTSCCYQSWYNPSSIWSSSRLDLHCLRWWCQHNCLLDSRGTGTRKRSMKRNEPIVNSGWRCFSDTLWLTRRAVMIVKSMEIKLHFALVSHWTIEANSVNTLVWPKVPVATVQRQHSTCKKAVAIIQDHNPDHNLDLNQPLDVSENPAATIRIVFFVLLAGGNRGYLRIVAPDMVDGEFVEIQCEGAAPEDESSIQWFFNGRVRPPFLSFDFLRLSETSAKEFVSLTLLLCSITVGWTAGKFFISFHSLPREKTQLILQLNKTHTNSETCSSSISFLSLFSWWE